MYLSRDVSTSNMAEPQARPRVLAGKRLDRRSWRGTPTESALLAVDLVAGKVTLEHLTPKQALALTGANWRFFWVARDLSPTERAAVEAGGHTLSSLARGRRKSAGVA
jgi:hypothetical protein